MLLYRTLLCKKMARAPVVIKKIYGNQAWEQNSAKFSFLKMILVKKRIPPRGLRFFSRKFRWAISFFYNCILLVVRDIIALTYKLY